MSSDSEPKNSNNPTQNRTVEKPEITRNSDFNRETFEKGISESKLPDFQYTPPPPPPTTEGSDE